MEARDIQKEKRSNWDNLLRVMLEQHFFLL